MYKRTYLESIMEIESIVTMHYFEFAKDYVFKGERHEFWEFLYVDKGQVEILANNEGYRLYEGDIVFHKPDEFHAVWANGTIAPNIVVISFYCYSEAIKFFENKIFKLKNEEINIIGEILREGNDSFLNVREGHVELFKSNKNCLGGEQIIKMDLERLLINLIRLGGGSSNKDRISSSVKEKMEKDLVEHIEEYLKVNIDRNYSFEDICLKFSVGSTQLKTVFKKKLGMGVMTYFNKLKMDEAKKLIRQSENNITEIADMLGYNSIHYFSKAFKKYTGMTPSQYSKSVKAKGLL